MASPEWLELEAQHHHRCVWTHAVADADFTQETTGGPRGTTAVRSMIDV
jgi:hypothetical protein